MVDMSTKRLHIDSDFETNPEQKGVNYRFEIRSH